MSNDKDKDSIVEELLKPRYKCIADYPESDYKVGDILPYKNDILYKHECLFFDKYPHLFKPLASLKPGDSKDDWDERFFTEHDAKGWLNKEGYPNVMPMTLDNLGIILDRYTKYLSSPPEPSSKGQEGESDFEFTEWAATNYIRLHRVWVGRYQDQRDKENFKTTKQIFEIYKSNNYGSLSMDTKSNEG